MLKITFVTGTNLMTGRGTEKFLLNILKNRPDNGLKCTVVQSDYIIKKRLSQKYVKSMLSGVRILTAKKELDSNIIKTLQKLRYSNKFLNYPLGILVHLLTFRYWRKENKEIIKEISKTDILYLVDNNYIEHLDVNPNTMVIGSTHHKKFDERFKLFNYRYKRINGIHFQTIDSMEKAVFRKKLDFYVQSGVDTKLYKPKRRKINKEKIKLLFVSGLEIGKGLLTAIEAWKRLPKQFELHIVGKGSLENYVNNLNLPNLFYHGALTEKELAKMYSTCDILIFPSPGETFGLVVLEAIASGEFVVTTTGMKGNFDELNKLGVLAYVEISPKAFEFAVKNAALRLQRKDFSKASKNAIKFIKETYDWGVVSRLFFEKLKEKYRLYQRE